MDNVFEKSFMRHVVNKKLPLVDTLNMFLEGNRYSRFGNVYCPFHENTDTPAAKIYESEDGDSLMCFSEHRRYFPSDVFEKGLASMSLEQIFYQVWHSLSVAEQEYFLSENPDSYKIVLLGTEKLLPFKQGKISFKEALNILLKDIKVDTVKIPIM